MISDLRIKDFKCWQDTGQIKMAPLTVLFGANSSGKSSIGQLLHILKQTIDYPDRRTVIYRGEDRGDYVSPPQIGTFYDMVHLHDTLRLIEFEYTWDLTTPLSITDIKTNRNYYGNKMRFSASLGFDDADTYEVSRFEYVLLKGTDEVFSIGMDKPYSNKPYKINSTNYNLERTYSKEWDIDSPVRFYGFPETVVANYQNAGFVQSLNLQHEMLFNSFSYLGPFRAKPLRLYTWTGSSPENVGYNGQLAFQAFRTAQRKKIRIGNDKTSNDKEEMVIEELIENCLRKLGLAEAFKISDIRSDQGIYELIVHTFLHSYKSKNSIADAGFGISQVFPVLVQLFYAPAGSILFMEQPEIHLHPQAQSELADVMIDAITAEDENGPRGIQLIIETHSEHFLRRLQRRIAEDAIANEQIAMYFAEKKLTCSDLVPLEIDKYGNISNWPKNFFGDEMGDIAAQSLAALDKHAKERGK
jgi:predicted ATPase